MNTAFVVAAALGSVRGSLVAVPPLRRTTEAEGYLTSALRRVDLGALKPYGEALGGALIAIVGVGFWLWPAL
jgi:hypothetical protein